MINIGIISNFIFTWIFILMLTKQRVKIRILKIFLVILVKFLLFHLRNAEFLYARLINPRDPSFILDKVA